jgi:spore germination protein
MKKGEGKLKQALTALEEMTLEENRPNSMENAPKSAPNTAQGNGEKGKQENPQMKGAGMERAPIPDMANAENQAKKDPAQAEQKCAEYFSKYKVQDFQCVGETVGKGYTAYNVQGYDQNDNLLFAEVDVHSGALVRFNYYAACNSVNFDMENAELIAKDFLTSLGYENMTASWVSENGTDADFTFAPEKDGVRIDPDSVKVKICRERGVVTAMDASKYLKNHKTRSLEKPTLTKEQAQAYLNENVTVEKATLALVKTKRGEKTAYEFLCSYGEEKYLIYTDANTGNELAILNVKNR